MNCKKCNQPGEFSLNHRVCKRCRADKAKDYYKNNREVKLHYYQERRTQLADNARFKKYSLTPDAYQAMLDDQEGLCRICDVVMTKPVVDHNHETGEVRGLLCSNCNRGIGLLKDNPDLCDNAALYLRYAGKEDTNFN